MLMIFPWIFKLYTCVFYIVPWAIYMIFWILTYPCEGCCYCIRKCRARYKSKAIDESYSYSVSVSEDMEGGDEEDDDDKQYQSGFNTDRPINATDIELQPRRKKKGKKEKKEKKSTSKSPKKEKKEEIDKKDKKRSKSKSSKKEKKLKKEENGGTEHLETNIQLDDLEANPNTNIDEGAKDGEKKKKKKKRKRVRKHVSASKFSGRRKKAPEDRKKRDHRNPNDLYFFSRVWRDIGNKWCYYCDEDIYNYHEYWV